MTAPEPSTGTQDLAEKVARARWERRRAEEDINLTWEQIEPIFHESHRKIAARWLADMEIAGLAVVELPETVLTGRYQGVGFEVEIPSHDGRGWEVYGVHVPGYNEDKVTIGHQFWDSIGRARLDAARILAACDAVERLRAEHQGGEPR